MNDSNPQPPVDAEALHTHADIILGRIRYLEQFGLPTDYTQVMGKATHSQLPGGTWEDYVEAWDYLARLGVVERRPA